MSVQAEVITIGDEILIGQITDTNSQWIAQKLLNLGIAVCQITSIPDAKEDIINTLKAAESRADLIIITGGLGPTNDDITKHTLAEYFNSELVFNETIFENVKDLFASAGVTMPAINRQQAEVPACCTPIANHKGTAPGMWFDRDDKVIISLPGVPYEMKHIMETDLLERINNRFETIPIHTRTIITQGIGESALAEMIEQWENSLAADEIKVAYLPSFGSVRIRLTAVGDDNGQIENIEKKLNELQALIPEYYIGNEQEELQVLIGNLLKENNATLATAESCTGGNIAHLITSVAGSSRYYKGSIVSYANEVKTNMLGVKQQDIEQYGAVSKQIVEQMAIGAAKQLGADYAIATSGIAGPDGGSTEKPVGTVWFAIAAGSKVISEQCQFGNTREKVIQKSSFHALAMLRRELLSVKN